MLNTNVFARKIFNSEIKSILFVLINDFNRIIAIRQYSTEKMIDFEIQLNCTEVCGSMVRDNEINF
jgi:hypothetical protein